MLSKLFSLFFVFVSWNSFGSKGSVLNFLKESDAVCISSHDIGYMRVAIKGRVQNINHFYLSPTYAEISKWKKDDKLKIFFVRGRGLKVYHVRSSREYNLEDAEPFLINRLTWV